MRGRFGQLPREKSTDAAVAFAGRLVLLSVLVIAGILAYQFGLPYLKKAAESAGADYNAAPRKAALAQAEPAVKPAAPPEKKEAKPRSTSRRSQPSKVATAATTAPAVPAPPAPPAAPIAATTRAPENSDIIGMAKQKAPDATPTETHAQAPNVRQADSSARPAAIPAKTTESVVDDEDIEAKRVGARPAKPSAAGEKPTEKKDEPKDAASVLGLKKKEADKTDPAKALTPVLPTGSDPAFVPFDAQKMDSGPDRAFSIMLANVLPGWHSKDVSEKNSTVGMTHRGGDSALAIRPINEVLPAKLIAAIDVPLQSKARLLFEVSSKNGGQEWLLSASIANTPVYQKIPIRTQESQPWQLVTLDLSRLAGKRVEVVLEAAMNLKLNSRTSQKTYQEQVAYFRAIRLDWPGRPQMQQKAQAPAEGTNQPPPAEAPKTQP